MDSGFLGELGATYNHCLLRTVVHLFITIRCVFIKNREEAREEAAVTRYQMADRGLPDWFP